MSRFFGMVIVATAAVGVAGGAARAQRTVCDSPCKFILLPLQIPRSVPVPNSDPLSELQGRIQSKPPFIVGQVPADTIPVGQSAFFEYQVDKRAFPLPGSISPQYPDSLKKAKVEGQVVVSFIVDTVGRVEPNSIHLLKSTDRMFTAAVMDALPTMTYAPAELHGAKVRQLVISPFAFNIAK